VSVAAPVGEFIDIRAVLGHYVTFVCSSPDAGVDWRCSNNKYPNILVYGYNHALRNTSEEFSVKDPGAGGYYNLSLKAVTSDGIRCKCFASDGSLQPITQYNMTVITGNVNHSSFFVYIYMQHLSSTFEVNLCSL